MEVGRLNLEECKQFIDKLGVSFSCSELVDTLAKESQGHPLFLAELCNYAAAHPENNRHITLEDAISERLETLEDATKRLMEVIALAGAPIPQRVATEAAGLSAADQQDGISQLRSSRLTTTTGTRTTDTIEPYHDRIRSAVVQNFSDAYRVQQHAAIAAALERFDSSDPQLIAAHWEGAGILDKAVSLWSIAAQTAESSLAFDQAALLYQKCINALTTFSSVDNDQQRSLQIRLAESLANGGRGPQAATAFCHAAAQSPTKIATELKRRAADQLLRSGHIDEGIAMMEQVMKEEGLPIPREGIHAIVSFLQARSLLKFRLLRYQLLGARKTESCGNAARLCDLYWDLFRGTMAVDHLRGVYFHTCSFTYALETGDQRKIGRSLAMESAARYAMSGSLEQAYQILDEALLLAGKNREWIFASVLRHYARNAGDVWWSMATGCPAFPVRKHLAGCSWPRSSLGTNDREPVCSVYTLLCRAYSQTGEYPPIPCPPKERWHAAICTRQFLPKQGRRI